MTRRCAWLRVGLLAVAVALLAPATVSLPWFRSGGSGFFAAAGQDTFYEIHLALGRVRVGTSRTGVGHDVHIGLAGAYFGWLGWTAPGVTVLVALLATLVRSVRVRAVAVLVAVAAATVTIWSLDLVSYSGPSAARIPGGAPSFADYLAHSGLGAWFAVVAYVLLAVAAALGRPPRAVAPPTTPAPAVTSLAGAGTGD